MRTKKGSESKPKAPQVEKKIKEPKSKPQVEKKVKEPKSKTQVEKKVKEKKVMAKIKPVDTGWFAGTGGTIADKNGNPTSWKIIVGDDRIADMRESDPYCDGITRDKTDDMGNERIRKHGSDTGFFFNHDFSIMQDDNKGSIEDLFKRNWKDIEENKPQAEQVEMKVVSQEASVAHKPENKLQIKNKKKIVGHETRTNRWGYFFVAPFVIVFFIFNLWPTLYTFILSFTDLQGLRSGLDFKFVGFTNFIKLVKDVYFWGALGNTFIIWGFNFIPQLGLALVLAIWLSDTRLNLAGKGLFRAIVYMPNLLTAASVALLFRSIFGFGAHVTAPANQFLYSLGIQATKIDPITGETVREAINFFRNVAFSRGLVAFIQWWMWYGYTLIILMAGITTISPSLYESAVIDGANSRQTTWYITLPLLRPIMLYILITSAIGGMQMFDIPFLLTDMQGGPDFKIRTTTLYQYNRALGRGATDYAYGAAVSIGIFLVTIVLALLIFFFLQDRSELKNKKQKGGK